jgi:hypothetical protein
LLPCAWAILAGLVKCLELRRRNSRNIGSLQCIRDLAKGAKLIELGIQIVFVGRGFDRRARHPTGRLKHAAEDRFGGLE